MRWLGLALVLLAGCDGAVVPSPLESPATWSSMVYAAKDGPILVRAEGAALGAPAEVWATVAARAMSGAVIGYPTRFTADPERAPRRNFRTVLLLNPAPGVGDAAVCEGRGASTAGVPGRVAAILAFCNDRRLLAAARGKTAAAGPDDPAAISLLRQLARHTFRSPRRDLKLFDPWTEFE